MPTDFDVTAFANAWTGTNVDRLTDFYANDATLVTPDRPDGVHGREQIRGVAKDWHTSFSDMRVQVLYALRQADRAALLMRIQGTNTGDLEVAEGKTVPATGKPVDYEIASFIELDGEGKVKREVALFDNAAIMEQLGLSSLLAAQAGASTTSSGSRPQTR